MSRTSQQKLGKTAASCRKKVNKSSKKALKKNRMNAKYLDKAIQNVLQALNQVQMIVSNSTTMFPEASNKSHRKKAKKQSRHKKSNKQYMNTQFSGMTTLPSETQNTICGQALNDAPYGEHYLLNNSTSKGISQSTDGDYIDPFKTLYEDNELLFTPVWAYDSLLPQETVDNLAPFMNQCFSDTESDTTEDFYFND